MSAFILDDFGLLFNNIAIFVPNLLFLDYCLVLVAILNNISLWLDSLSSLDISSYVYNISLNFNDISLFVLSHVYVDDLGGAIFI